MGIDALILRFSIHVLRLIVHGSAHERSVHKHDCGAVGSFDKQNYSTSWS